MGIQDLQTFLESAAVEGGAVSVDLLRIARNHLQRQQQAPIKRTKFHKLKLVLDAECCLDRLYGGYFSDWACGGQWNRTVQFLSLLMNAIEMGHIELAVIFNGALETQRMSEWIAEQHKIRQRMNMVLKHINTKGTPPPKVWWCPPTCLRTVLRMALRHLNTVVMCSMDDHHQEVIAYCRENGFHGLIADDAEYAAFDPPRYFSSENLKLTYKGSLETKEFMISELCKNLNLSNSQICVLAALLGNFHLSDTDLQDIYRLAGVSNGSSGGSGAQHSPKEHLVRSLAEYVVKLPPTSEMEALVQKVVGPNEERGQKFRESVQYYLNGTKDGFLKYRTATTRRPDLKKRQVPASSVSATTTNNSTTNSTSNINSTNSTSSTNSTTNNSARSAISSSEDQDLDTSGFASETTEREQKSLEDYKMATAKASGLKPEIVIETTRDETEVTERIERFKIDDKTPRSNDTVDSSSLNGPSTNGSALLPSCSTSGASSMSCSPRHQHSHLQQPRVSVEVMRTATERHQKGLMSPLIYHALVSNEVRLPVVMEDEAHREFPAAHLVFRPVRQKVYAILFNLHHLHYLANKTKMEQQHAGEGQGNSSNSHGNIQVPEITVREWVYTHSNPYLSPLCTPATPLNWAVPTIQRLWFGSTVDDKRRRLRAFLTCLSSDSALMLNPSYVPQHMLIMACVLRYIMSQDKCILRKQELDAFIAQAFSPELMNSQYLQELALPLVTSRGVQLAALFMHGVETALLANDACGAPIPWLMSCPWLYLDGKLFHHTLARAAVVKNLLELCENHIDRVVKVERMRKAIVEGIDVQFAKPPLPPLSMIRPGLPPPNCLPPVSLPSTRGPAGLARRALPARGGQLQVAGVVVGQWGANYGFSHQLRPQGPYSGGGARGRGLPPGQGYPMAGRTFMQNKNHRGPTWPTNKKAVQNKKKNPPKKTKGRGLTVQLQSGETVLGSEVAKTDESEGPVDPQIFDDSKTMEHKGQGDGPAFDSLGVSTLSDGWWRCRTINV